MLNPLYAIWRILPTAQEVPDATVLPTGASCLEHLSPHALYATIVDVFCHTGAPRPATRHSCGLSVLCHDQFPYPTRLYGGGRTRGLGLSSRCLGRLDHGHPGASHRALVA